MYLTFNSKNADKAALVFPPDSVDCMTPHRLAYHAVGHKYRKRLNGGKLKGFDLAKAIGIQVIGTFTRAILGEIVVTVIDQFCYSADKKISVKHIPEAYDSLFQDDVNSMFVKQAIVSFAEQAWDLLCEEDCVLPVSHDLISQVVASDRTKIR